MKKVFFIFATLVTLSFSVSAQNRFAPTPTPTPMVTSITTVVVKDSYENNAWYRDMFLVQGGNEVAKVRVTSNGNVFVTATAASAPVFMYRVRGGNQVVTLDATPRINSNADASKVIALMSMLNAPPQQARAVYTAETLFQPVVELVNYYLEATHASTKVVLSQPQAATRPVPVTTETKPRVSGAVAPATAPRQAPAQQSGFRFHKEANFTTVEWGTKSANDYVKIVAHGTNFLRFYGQFELWTPAVGGDNHFVFTPKQGGGYTWNNRPSVASPAGAKLVNDLFAAIASGDESPSGQAKIKALAKSLGLYIVNALGD